jgi:hypothetical protein
MAFLAKKDNAKSTITNNPLASDGLSITLQTGDGAKFPATSDGQWVATIWDKASYPDASDDPNMEKVLIESRSTDTLTVNASGRGYDGTTGVEHSVNSAIALFLIVKHLTDIETELDKKVSSKTNEIFVDKGGNDTTGDGTMGKPYLTVQKAIDVVEAADSGTTTLIVIGAGTYAENITVKEAMSFVGDAKSRTIIQGLATFDTLTTGAIPFRNIQFKNTNNHAIVMNFGSDTAKLALSQCIVRTTWTSATGQTVNTSKASIKALRGYLFWELGSVDTIAQGDSTAEHNTSSLWVTGSDLVLIESFSVQQTIENTTDAKQNLEVVFNNNTNAGTWIGFKNGCMTFTGKTGDADNYMAPFYNYGEEGTVLGKMCVEGNVIRINSTEKCYCCFNWKSDTLVDFSNNSIFPTAVTTVYSGYENGGGTINVMNCFFDTATLPTISGDVNYSIALSDGDLHFSDDIYFKKSVTYGGPTAIGVPGYSGKLTLKGKTSGTVNLQVADVAGTWTGTLPTNDGDSGQVLSTNGSGVMSWITPPTQYTDELAQDAVGGAVGNGLDYDDDTGAISVDETELTHNSLGSKQGGTTDEYYHLTSAQATIVANTSGTNTGDQTLPVKASGAELDTATDDAKFATAKAIKDAHNVPSVAPSTSGNLLTSNGTDWTSAAPPVSVSVTTKGDVQTYSTAPARLPVGTNGQVLSANSGETTGLKWVDISGSTLEVSIAQNSHGFTAGDVIKSAGTANAFAKAQADSSANAEVVGIVSVVTDENNFKYVSSGYLTAGVPTATAGTVYYLSPTTAGALTATEPTTVGHVSKPVMVVLESAAKAQFFNMRGYEITDIGWNSYIIDSSDSSTATTLTGTINGSNKDFTLSQTPSSAKSENVYLNGVRQSYTSDYTMSGTTLSFVTAPVSGDVIVVAYLTGGTGSGNADTLDGAHKPTGDIVGTSDTQTLTNKTITPESWASVSFQNSWSDFSSDLTSCQYMKTPDGFVHIKGVVTGGTVADNTPIFTLPTGYRPPKRMVFCVMSNGAVGRVDIYTTGVVCVLVGSNIYLSLDGINFRP